MATATANTLIINHGLSEKVSEDVVGRLKSNLQRYTRSNDRRMVLRSLKEAEVLKTITLETPSAPPNVSFADLEHELVEETVVLNDFSFKPLSTVERKDVFKNAGMNSGCLVIMKGLADRLCEHSIERKWYGCGLDGKTLYETLVTRMARSSASADVFQHLHDMLGTHDLVVKRVFSGQTKNATTPGDIILKSSSEGSSSSDNSSDDKPIHINVYSSNGGIQMTLDMTLEFGLFRKSDINMNRPWIALKAVIHERANLSTGKNYRVMEIKTPSLY